jgi:hypothetical protein
MHAPILLFFGKAIRMWLIFCESNDISALWAFHGLKARGLKPIKIISSEMLACSLRWKHRLGTEGASIEISLADDSSIRSDKIYGVLNRLQTIPSAHLRANPADREYAIQELYAFFLSWIHALPSPVLNPPTPQGLSGQWRHASEWVVLANNAGLPTLDYRQSSHGEIDIAALRGSLVPRGTIVETVIVVDGNVVGSKIPPAIAKSCICLAKMAETPLLGIEFSHNPSFHWTFAGATPLPNLRLGGQAVLDVLAKVLQGEREEK